MKVSERVGAPAVTVAIPFYNEEARLAAAIHSVLRQTMPSFELLLVDDGSTDRSLAVARSFDDPRIRVIADGRRRRLPARLNQIVREARADLIARMDGDDVVHPTRLARQLELLAAAPEVDVVGTWAGLVDEHGSAFAVVEAAELPPSPRVALERGLLVHASIVARRRWLLDNPYDESLSRAEDRDLWCRTLRSSRFAVVRAPLYVVTASARTPEFLTDYLSAQRQNRSLYVRHGPTMVGVPRAARLWLSSHGKSWVMRAAVAFGVAERLVQRRGRAPTDAETRLIHEALSRFAETEPMRRSEGHAPNRSTSS